MKYTEVTNPRYSSPNNATIDMEVKFEDFDEVMPFTANPNDVMPHGRELYQRAVAGDFGEVAPYTGPSAEELQAQAAREYRDNLLHDLDLVVANPLRWSSFSPDQQSAIAAYRQALLDVPQQTGFPSAINWPEKPSFLTPSH